MADVNIQEGYKNAAWFSANPTLVLLEGQKVNLEQTGTYKLGDGVTALSALSFLGGSGSVDVNTIGTAINGAASATPNDTDLVMSVESSVAKKNTWTQIKAFLKTYYDTIYTTTSAVASQISTAISGKLDANIPITGATKTKITYDAKGLITSGTDATTADINASTNRNYVTDAQLVVVGNTSGTNTGDNATNSTSNSYADGKVANDLTASTTVAPSKTAVNTALDLKEIALNYGAASVNPVDATTYYFSYFLTGISPSTTVTARPIKFTATRVLTDVIFTEQHSVNGSGETCTLYLRNVTTSIDYLIGTFLLNGGANTMIVNTFAGLSITVNSTDTWTWKMVMPTWVTNPTALLMNLTAELR